MSSVAPLLGADAFERTMSSAATPLRLRTGRSFGASYANTRHADINLTRIRVSAHGSHGGTRTGRRPLLIFTYLIDGRIELSQDGRTATLESGDFWMYSPDRPYEFEFRSTSEVVAVLLPTDQIRAYRTSVQGLTATRFDHDPVAGAIGKTVDLYEQTLPTLHPALRGRVVKQVVDAIGMFTEHAVLTTGMTSAHHVSGLQEALDFIDANLSAVELSPEAIARHLHVSRRSLYGLFEKADMTVAKAIRDRRLERCERDLVDPSLAAVPVSEIGTRWGITSPSHFSRLFKQSYGVTPTDYRVGLGR